jgi:hypothetical protein
VQNRNDALVESIGARAEFPSVGETAAEVMDTMNMVLRNLRDQEQGDLETGDKGPCHEECFLGNWSNVEYSHALVRGCEAGHL